jgi:hypothetical protein
MKTARPVDIIISKKPETNHRIFHEKTNYSGIIKQYRVNRNIRCIIKYPQTSDLPEGSHGRRGDVLAALHRHVFFGFCADRQVHYILRKQTKKYIFSAPVKKILPCSNKFVKHQSRAGDTD